MPRCTTSIAMATCDGAQFLRAQLDSITAQTRPPDELVVSDDASSDDTLVRLEAFAARAPFSVRLLRNEDRLGATANFEACLKACSGEIVFLADQDDVWETHKIETLAATLEDRPELGLVFSNGQVVDQALTSLGYDLWQALFFDTGDQRRVREGEGPAVFARRVVAAGTTLAFRNRYGSVLHPFPDLPSVHDAWIAFLIACLSDCDIVEEPLIRYRLHDANQIGLRKRGLLEQLAQARRQIARNAFAQDAAFFSMARERLEDSPLRPGAHDVIEQKLTHARVRDAMPASFWARLPHVFREWSSGRYDRFGYGVKSAAQDLWLR